MSDTPIYGLDKTLDECDWIYAHIPAAVTREDNGLFKLKWFDYRELHSVHATYLFADAYRTAYREAFRRNYDYERAEFVSGIAGEDIFAFETKTLASTTGFIKARQWADALGMPYIEFARIAMTWAMRRQRKYPPRPSMLYSFDILTAIQETWRDRQTGQMFVAAGDQFKNQRYVGHPTQDAHHEWLLQQAALRANADHYLARVLYVDDVLLESKVEARFGADMLARIQSLH